MRIGVVGLGYLGLTHAVAMTELGHQVVGYDVDHVKVDKVSNGELPFYEPGLGSALAAAIFSGKLVAKLEPGVGDRVDIIFLCVGTPSLSTGEADLSQLFKAVASIEPLLHPNVVVVGKSTTPPGTAERLAKLLSSLSPNPVPLCWNPEFLREGSALRDALEPDRIVIGSVNGTGVELLKSCYEIPISKGVPVIETDLQTSELVKLSANAFLATKISFINAISEIAEASGGDALAVSRALGFDVRIGAHFLHPGLGFGGGCLAKDIQAFQAYGASLGVESLPAFLHLIQNINSQRRKTIVELAVSELGSVQGKRILVLGASFKPNTDDMRDSPSLEVAQELFDMGASVSVHDPMAHRALLAKYPHLEAKAELSAAADRQHLVILGTDWQEYSSIDPFEFGSKVAQKILIDGRNLVHVDLWRSAGWKVIALGRNV